MSETYKMNVKCINCGTEFLTEIEKGKQARYYGACPYCGCNSPYEFDLKKPQDLSSLSNDSALKHGWLGS